LRDPAQKRTIVLTISSPLRQWNPYATRAEPGDMARERKTAQELADLIAAKIGVRELFIRVRKDHAYGWEPTVEDAPGDIIGFQRRAEEIATRLRMQYDLRE